MFVGCFFSSSTDPTKNGTCYKKQASCGDYKDDKLEACPLTPQGIIIFLSTNLKLLFI
jgi:hypothetical protein